MRGPLRYFAWPLLLVAVGVGCESTTPGSRLEEPLPPAALDMPTAADGALQTVVLSGGCVWGVEAVFEHVKGIKDVVSGYSGGAAETARYDLITTGTTGHAESVSITFDPAQITYGQILRVFFSVAHDPTQVDGQYPDDGPHYRSNIFYANDQQRTVALAYITQLEATRLFPRRIATRVDPLVAFYRAEDDHQDYLANHLTEPYIVTFDLPRLALLERFFPELYRTR